MDDIPDSRREEYEQLLSLLLDSAVPEDETARQRAEWIARAALKPGHLWRGMGLNSRAEVRQIMRESFPELEAQNDRDMRWKKFLYRRMCGWSGFSA